MKIFVVSEKSTWASRDPAAPYSFGSPLCAPTDKKKFEFSSSDTNDHLVAHIRVIEFELRADSFHKSFDPAFCTNKMQK